MIKMEKKKKIYAVGIGPGGGDDMTGRAKKAIEASEVIVGYGLYLDLLGELANGKTLLSSPMTRESERCRLAVGEALKGKTVALVSSGDAGVYGMAGPLCEVAQEHPEVEVEVIPGVTAACGAAAVLGAPLTHDFAVISLSDLLTPWEKIEKRLRAAAEADFVICLYNPASRKRADYLSRACKILLENLDGERPCGMVRNVGRENEEHRILTLRELAETPADMLTTVVIGNSTTKAAGGRLVTPRGYREI